MTQPFTIPDTYKNAFRRLLPYMSTQLRSDENALNAILLYLKMGNEKLARIVIDAYNENRRLQEIEEQKRLRDEALLLENLLEDEADFDEDEEKEDDKEDSDQEEDADF